MARQVLPTLPWINEAVLDAAKRGVFQNILFGGLMSDIIQNQMIRESMDQIEVGCLSRGHRLDPLMIRARRAS